MKKRLFTLVEIVVVIGILSMVMVVGVSLLRHGLNVREANKEVGSQLLVERNLMSAILADLKACQPLSKQRVPLYFAVDKVQAVGEPSSVHMICHVPKTMEEGEGDLRGVSWLNEVSYVLDPNPLTGDFTLFRRMQEGHDKDIRKGGGWQEVYGRVSQFKLECFDGEEWLDTWDSKEQEGMPQMIRLTVGISPLKPQASDDFSEPEPIMLEHTLTVAQHLNFTLDEGVAEE